MPLTIHFLNVGEGDCTIIEHPSGRISVVDLSSIKSLDPTTLQETLAADRTYQAAKSLGMDLSVFAKTAAEKLAPKTDALEYYDSHIGKYADIFRLIVTHPHMDHITGMHRLINHEPKDVENFWHSSKLNFDLDTADWSKVGSRYSKDDWETYRHVRDSRNWRAFDQRQGSLRSFWKEDGIELWAPTDELVGIAQDTNNQNVLSMVIKVSHAGRSFLLGGDATGGETWPAIFQHLDMTGIDVLKASHHGRNSGYYWPAVKEMAPWLTITSVGAVEHDATQKYRQYSEHTVSTRFTGDVRITVHDDGRLTYPGILEDHWKSRKAAA